MLKRHFAIVNFIRICLDAVAIATIWNFSYFLRFHCGLFSYTDIPRYSNHLTLTIPVVFIICLSRYWFGIYKSIRIQTIGTQIQKQISSIVLGYILIIAFLYYVEKAPYTRVLLFLFFFLLLAGLLSCHFMLVNTLRYMRARGYNQRHYAIIGTGKNALRLFRDIRRCSYWGLTCAFFLDDNPRLDGKTIQGIPIYGHIEQLPDILKAHQIDEIYLAKKSSPATFSILEKLQYSGITVRILPDWGGLTALSRPSTLTVGTSILFTASEPPLSGMHWIIKDLFDRLIALLLIILLAIPMLLIAVLIKCTSKGPAFYKHQRIGMNQKAFHMIKFRTMREGTLEQASWTVKDDPRRTRLGAFLRSTSLDELPQLFNVLKGDMSLVGPRPEQPEYVEKFSEEYKKYMLRHRVKSGMTGWAQIHGYRGDTSIRKRVQYDLYYIQNWSLGLDLVILLRTLFHLFKDPNAY